MIRYALGRRAGSRLGRRVRSADCRGLLGRFQERAAVAIPHAAHFALIPLDLARAGDLGLRGVFIQQAATEEILNSHARDLGVQIRRGCELTALAQDADGVRIQFTGPGRDRRAVRQIPGRWAPNLALTARAGATSVAELLHAGRGVLLDLTPGGAFARAGHGWRDRIDIRTAQCPGPPAPALLIRPDGYVAWAATTDVQDTGTLRDALACWFGTPTAG